MTFDAYTFIHTPIGRLLLTEAGSKLVGVQLDKQTSMPPTPSHIPATSTALERAARQFEGYFAGSSRAFRVPSFYFGTWFQQDVWSALCEIPYGQTCSYEAIAIRVGRPRAVRAVGAAIGRNPLAIVVPCHRVLAKSGALAGFAWGLDCKRWLLEHERRVTAKDG